jgi:polysaccharide biosynthesis/export protein
LIKKADFFGLGLCLLLSCQVGVPVNAGVPILRSGSRYSEGQKIVETYQLGAGDKIQVTVFNEPQLSGEFQIGADGTVPLPLVGNVPALDKTPTEVGAEYTELLKRDYMRHPLVAVGVTLYRPFFIVGQVRTPGQYAYSAGLTVWNAIATAQGLTPRGRTSYVYIRKYGEEKEERYALTPDLRVWPGDTIRVAERFF